LKRALNPLSPDRRPYRRPEEQLRYSSAREQMADVSIVDETDGYLNLSGVLYSFVSLKELPDATFPGVLRELIGLDFPIIVNAQITIPDQAKVLKGYKGRLRDRQPVLNCLQLGRELTRRSRHPYENLKRCWSRLP
ncbi:MAG TPA: hypothetical protein VGK01_26245, partial [Candidatus Angelobacter sp.]